MKVPCRTCGMEAASHLMVGGLCPGCRLDTWIPPGYEDSENYEYDTVHGHPNATAHPPTGRAILDSTPRRLSQCNIPTGARKPR